MAVIPVDQREEVARLMDRLFDEATKLKELAHVYEAVSTSKTILSTVSAVAPNLGGLIQQTIQDQLVMILGRLSDASDMRKFRNASVLRLREYRSRYTPENLDSRIDEFLEIASDMAEARNKFGAHRDLDVRKANVGSINQYLRASELICEVVRDFSLDVCHHEALFGPPRAAAELSAMCNQAARECVSS